MHDLIIKSGTAHGTDVEVYLDGFKVQGLVECDLDLNAREPHRLRLELMVGSINKDDEILRQLVKSGAISK